MSEDGKRKRRTRLGNHFMPENFIHTEFLMGECVCKTIEGSKSVRSLERSDIVNTLSLMLRRMSLAVKTKG